MRKLLLTLAHLGALPTLAKGLPAAQALSATPPASQTAAQLVFHYERPGLPVPVYTLTVREDGSGSYEALPVVAPSANPYSVAPDRSPGRTEQPVTLNLAESARVFAWVRAAHDFKAGCASKAKGIANTGLKTLTYTSGSETGSCSYNFSENKSVVELVEFLQAVAFTLDEARKLESEHRFDRLALDAEMTSLVAAVIDGRAGGLSSIRPTLASLADDPQVLERVRNQARKLLEQSTLTR